MKVIIEGAVAYIGDVTSPEVPVTIIIDEHENVPAGCVHLVHPDVTLEVGVDDLARALRPFLKG